MTRVKVTVVVELAIIDATILQDVGKVERCHCEVRKCALTWRSAYTHFGTAFPRFTLRLCRCSSTEHTTLLPKLEVSTSQTLQGIRPAISVT